MGAPKKNEFWKARSTHGREKIFKTPEILNDAANQYFQWCLDNPLMESVVSSGKIFHLPKMRAMTIAGLCIFLDIRTTTFDNYRDKSNVKYKDYLGVTTRIEQIIATQKFEGAAAGMLNANIIARDLGLKEKAEIEQTVKNDLSGLSTEELKERANAMRNINGKT